MFRNFVDTVECLVDFAVTFEQEGNGYDTYRKNAHGLGFAGNDGGCTGSGTTAHTGSDEYHFGAVVEHGADLFHTFLGCLTGACRTVAGSESFLA